MPGLDGEIREGYSEEATFMQELCSQGSMKVGWREVQGRAVSGPSLVCCSQKSAGAGGKPKMQERTWERVGASPSPFPAFAQRGLWRRGCASLAPEEALLIIQPSRDSIIIIFQGPDMCNIKKEIM